MSGILWVTLVLCFSAGWTEGQALDAGSASHATKATTCNCQVPNGCSYAPSSTSKAPEEVMVMTDHTDQMHMDIWEWDAFHVVISTVEVEVTPNNKVACKAHSKGKRYGFTVQLPDFVEKNITASETENWIETVKKKQFLWYADHVVIDMTGPLGSPHLPEVLNEIDSLMTNISKIQALNDRIYCIVPWSPPCDGTSCDVAGPIMRTCSVLLMGPDSYKPDTTSGCKAQATIPIGQFLLGIDQYLNLVNSKQKIVAGIPWHGYNYTCYTFDSNNMCRLSKDGTCNFMRRKISLGQIQVSGLAQDSFIVDPLTQSVYYNSKENNNKYQIWFENFETLSLKYKLVKALELRGFAIWYAEDLKYEITTKTLDFDKLMWGWVLHQVFVQSDHTPVSRGHVYADTVAGVGVGCLILGTVLGVTFACIALRRCDRRGSHLNRPFKLDDADEEFRDDNGL